MGRGRAYLVSFVMQTQPIDWRAKYLQLERRLKVVEDERDKALQRIADMQKHAQMLFAGTAKSKREINDLKASLAASQQELRGLKERRDENSSSPKGPQRFPSVPMRQGSHDKDRPISSAHSEEVSDVNMEAQPQDQWSH